MAGWLCLLLQHQPGLGSADLPPAVPGQVLHQVSDRRVVGIRARQMAEL